MIFPQNANISLKYAKTCEHDLNTSCVDTRPIDTYVFVLAFELGPTPLECIFNPGSELHPKLLVERPEEVENLDHIERRLPVEVDRLELLDNSVHKRLETARVFVVEDMLRANVRE